MTSRKLTIFLWFENQADEASKYYTNVFPDSKITRTTQYLENGAKMNNREPGSVMSVEFELNGYPFVALNGGPMYKFSAATSFMIDCKDQEEVNYYWEKLSKDGDLKKQRCGWVEDKFGVTWQVVPSKLTELIRGGDEKQASRVTDAMMKMGKLDIGGLQKAFDGLGE